MIDPFDLAAFDQAVDAVDEILAVVNADSDRRAVAAHICAVTVPILAEATFEVLTDLRSEIGHARLAAQLGAEENRHLARQVEAVKDLVHERDDRLRRVFDDPDPQPLAESILAYLRSCGFTIPEDFEQFICFTVGKTYERIAAAITLSLATDTSETTFPS